VTANIEYYLSPEKKMKSARIHVVPYFGLMDTLDGNTGNAVKNFSIQVGVGIPVGAGSESEG
jgi:hypothetical protein